MKNLEKELEEFKKFKKDFKYVIYFHTNLFLKEKN